MLSLPTQPRTTRLSRHLKRNFGWLITPLAAVAVLATADGIAQLVGMTLAPTPALLAANLSSSRRPHPSLPFHATSADAILAHNPFDSTPHPAITPPSDDPVEDDPDPRNAPPCDGLRVSGIVTSADPEWSLASFEESDPQTASRTLLRRRGGEVGARRVAFIAWDRVWMETATGLCQASLFAPQAAPAPPPPVARGPARPDVALPAPALEGWISKGIEVVSPTERNIDRGIIPRLIEKQAELLKNTQARLEVVGGKRLGFRVSGIRPDSLLGNLGIVDGDRLESINGYDLTDAQAAMEAYANLLRADHLALLVNRGGKELRLELNVR